MIISTDRLPRKVLEALGDWEAKEIEHANDQDLRHAELLMAWPTKITKAMMSKMEELQAIQTFSAGVDDLDFRIIPQRVRVFSNAGAYALSVAEHVWALILALAKGVNDRQGSRESYQLHGKTVLILGCGRIGSLVAKMARCFGIGKVRGISRSFSEPQYFDERHGPSELLSVMGSADVIVSALPLNKHTKNLLTYEYLKRTKGKAIIVNVARAEMIEEASIYRILLERPETRFATDVFWRRDGIEDFDSRLWELQNFMGTRHTAGAGASEEVREAAMLIAAENVALFLKTGQARNEIKREDYI